MLHKLPLISCLCVTYKKPLLLKRAIACFEAQTYRNKELVILYEDHDTETRQFLRTCPLSSRVKLVCVPGTPKKTLGELRNIAIQAAHGDFVCQWDDDDWFHRDRLTYQYNTIVDNKVNGSLLTRWVTFDGHEKKAFVSNRRRWEGSVLCRKSLFALKAYEKKEKGEDTDVIEYLCEHNHLACIEDMPFLYVYVYHGKNTWSFNHFSGIFRASRELAGYSGMIKNILDETYNAEESAVLLNSIPFNTFTEEGIKDNDVIPGMTG